MLEAIFQFSDFGFWMKLCGALSVRETDRKKKRKMKRQGDQKLSKLQQKFKKKLKGAQFRWINEELYTKDSEVSFKEMNEQRTLRFFRRGFPSKTHTQNTFQSVSSRISRTSM